MNDALKAIAEPRRQEILRLVWSRERAAGDIAQHFDVSRPAISKHLRVLKEAGLSRSAGKGRGGCTSLVRSRSWSFDGSSTASGTKGCRRSRRRRRPDRSGDPRDDRPSRHRARNRDRGAARRGVPVLHRPREDDRLEGGRCDARSASRRRLSYRRDRHTMSLEDSTSRSTRRGGSCSPSVGRPTDRPCRRARPPSRSP